MWLYFIRQFFGRRASPPVCYARLHRARTERRLWCVMVKLPSVLGAMWRRGEVVFTGLESTVPLRRKTLSVCLSMSTWVIYLFQVYLSYVCCWLMFTPTHPSFCLQRSLPFFFFFFGEIDGTWTVFSAVVRIWNCTLNFISILYLPFLPSFFFFKPKHYKRIQIH